MFLPLSPSPQHFDIETRDERRGISIRDAGRRKKTFVSPVEVVENSEGRGGGGEMRVPIVLPRRDEYSHGFHCLASNSETMDSPA